MGISQWEMNVTKRKQTDQQSDIYLVCGVDTKLDLTVPPKSHAVGNIPFNWGELFQNGHKIVEHSCGDPSYKFGLPYTSCKLIIVIFRSHILCT